MEDWNNFPYKSDLFALKLEYIELKRKMEDSLNGILYYFGRYEQKKLENVVRAREVRENCDEETKELMES